MNFVNAMSHVPVIGMLFGLFVENPIDQIKDVLKKATGNGGAGSERLQPEAALEKITEICGDNQDLAPIAQAATAGLESNPFDSAADVSAPETALSQISQMVGYEQDSNTSSVTSVSY